MSDSTNEGPEGPEGSSPSGRAGESTEPPTTIPAGASGRSALSRTEEGPRPEDEGKETIGRFVIEGTLGRGGMGRVLLARDTRIQRQVALKVLDVGGGTEGIASSEQRSRFLNEARAIGRLSHPNIVEIYDTAEDDETGKAWIAMELVKGSDLLKLIREEVSPERLLEIAEQVAAALSHAHERGIVHRDLKPSNVLIDHEGRVRLGDWGIARLEGVELTEPGSTIGSPPYMAPEQGLGAKATPQTDVHALALMIHEGLTGSRLRRKPTEPASPDLDGLMSGPSHLSRSKAATVARVLSRSFSLEPEARHGSPEDLVRAVREALQPSWTEAPLTAVVHAAAAPAWTSGPRWGVLALGLVGLVLLAVLGPWRASSPAPNSEPSAPVGELPSPVAPPASSATDERPRRPDPVEAAAVAPGRVAETEPTVQAEPESALEPVAPPQDRSLRLLLRSRVPGVLVVESGTEELLRVAVGEPADEAAAPGAEAAPPPMARVRGPWHATSLRLPRGEIGLRFMFLRPSKGEVALLKEARFDLQEESQAWAVLQVQGLLARQLDVESGLGPHPTGETGDKELLDAWMAARAHWPQDEVEPATTPP